MSATCNFIHAHTALAWGLVNHVVAHAELLPFVHRLATDTAPTDQDALHDLRHIRRGIEGNAAGRATARGRG